MSGRANLQLNPHEKFDFTSVGIVRQDVGLSCEAGCGGAMWAAVFATPARTSAACTPTSAFGCGFARGDQLVDGDLLRLRTISY